MTWEVKLVSKKADKSTMPAIVFEKKIVKMAKAFIRGRKNPSGYWKPGGPVGIKHVNIPNLIADDWVIVKTALSGICGSDMKELSLSGAIDNPIQTMISFPQIMGHEPTGIIEKVGTKVKKVKPGDRVAISPWLSCAPRGIFPECPRCQIGDYTHCKNFQKGQIPQGMHLGVAKGYGAFAPYFAVHESQCFILPDNVTFEQAVLADPFSVAFHSVLTLNPDPDSTILVYGLGVIGLSVVMCLKNIFQVQHIIGVGRYPFQKEMAMKLGAEHVFLSSEEGQLIEDIAGYMDVELLTPSKGYKWSISGVDGIIDNIASARTLEVGVRILKSQGLLVFPGVNTPKRCEMTPHYFKELEIIGSNAFSVEFFKGKRAHAFDFFLEFLADKKIDTSPLVTHKFPLEEYQEAFDMMANKKESNAIKVVFNFLH